MITAILNCYKRPQYLQEQIEAIKTQTVPPEEIWIWYNKPEDQEQVDLTNLGCKVVVCNHNFRYHGRFALALMAKTKYVCVFDDDTIPNKKWFENCLNYADGKYILGTTGVLLQGDKYDPNQKVGWNGYNNNELQVVDLVGHSWFLKTEYLKYLWSKPPISFETGEDMQLSANAYMEAGIQTAVPPHPAYNKELWGSNFEKGWSYGNDKNASHWNASTNRNLVASELQKAGYKKVKDR
jgi:hypothetical protein